MKKFFTALSLSITGIALPVSAQTDFQADSIFIRKIYNAALGEGKSYEWLRHLTQQVGPRLSGSEGAAKAVVYTKSVMEGERFDHVFLQNVMVPHWVRGAKEKAQIIVGKQKTDVPIAALGGSIATPKGGVKGKVIEVKSFQELRDLGAEKVKGKIVFFNRPMDPTKINTFEAYAGAVEQRAAGASEAAKLGAIGSITRSMTTRLDDFPHTGSMRYASGAPMIPAAAISTNGAELLSKTLKGNPETEFYFEQHCETLPDAPSHNVVGELKGKTSPDKYIAVGGHLDSWDFAQGAHDDGSGCVQSIEAVRILKALGYQPNNTLRAVMFMNEENGMKGGVTYADSAKSRKEPHIAAIESDHGGFSPRGFGIVGTPGQKAKIQEWAKLFAAYGVHELGPGGGGADIGPLAQQGTVLLGLMPDTQRYFDYHHAANDKFETVSKRELELGAAAMASMLYLIDKYGL
ncbi:M20/M25/M40 family metallo-hydrolase [Dyadobacter jiangsuensis]|uniref:Carboxypeptidase Q n=1 Tax=Dyadobacter jiangsuensis TaxID=1591085 RepID=A0A2P8G911_9BACT|nr:M20/M25/M40 family metallo-hydrolase [Dyadobacter jiangsuensis]PSL30448.1 peptidase M28-like protein [Dyadobacter jiangsuensis]